MYAWLDRLSIRSRILLLTVAAMLPLAALLAWVLHDDVGRAREGAYDKVRTLATGTAADLRRVLNRYESVLARVSARPMVRALDPANCDPLLSEYLPLSSAALGLEVRDAHGKVVCRYGPGLVPPAKGANRPEGEAAPPSGGFAASGVPVEDGRGRKLAALSYPVRDEAGEDVGLLVMTIDLPALNQRLLASTTGHEVVTVVDRTGAVLLRSADPAALIGTRLATGEPDPWGMPDGLVSAKGRDGVPRLAASITCPAPNGGWLRVCPKRKSSPTTGPRSGGRSASAWGYACWRWAFAWRLGASISGPVAQLQKAAGEVAAGKSWVRATHRTAGDPFGRLSSSTGCSTRAP